MYLDNEVDIKENIIEAIRELSEEEQKILVL
jgi:DNA-directed RNA polymerase specialized sigma subunit